MSWVILFFAGLFEVGWAVGLKYTDGFSKPLPTVLTVAAMAISLGLLGLAMKELPLGTAYAIWTGVGAVGTVIAGIILFGESMALVRLVSVALIVTGLVGLKVSASTTLGPRERVVIVEVEDARLVLGVTASSINVLHKLPPAPVEVDARAEAPADFQSVMKSLLKRSGRS